MGGLSLTVLWDRQRVGHWLGSRALPGGTEEALGGLMLAPNLLLAPEWPVLGDGSTTKFIHMASPPHKSPHCSSLDKCWLSTYYVLHTWFLSRGLQQ